MAIDLSITKVTRLADVANILVIYGVCAASMAFVGMIVPIASLIAIRVNASTSDMSLAIALYSAPSALLAIIGGGLVGRIGPRLALMGGALLIALADAGAYLATSLPMFDLATLFAGVGYTGVNIAAPALIIATTRGTFRTRAMSFWSTYPPAGFSLGLLLAAPFTASASWVVVPVIHGAVMMALIACTPLLARVARQDAVAVLATTAMRLREFLAVLRNWRLIRLAVVIALTSGIGYGTGIVAPSYLAKVHGVSMAASATTVAIAKMAAMLLAGFGTGELLSRRLNASRFFLTVAAIGIAAQVVLFLPASSFILAACGLGVWLMAYGCAMGICMAVLPDFARGSSNASQATGVVAQFTSIASFMAPPVYFTLHGWHSFVLMVFAGLSFCVFLLPGRSGSTVSAELPEGTTVPAGNA